MDVNAMGLPTNRPVQTQSSTPQPEAATLVADNYAGNASDVAKVNTSKAALPDGIGNHVDKAA